MKQQLAELERIHWRRAFPWVHLFQSFRIALDARKMLLAAVAMLILSGGFYAFSNWPLELTETEIHALRQQPWDLTPSVETPFGSLVVSDWKNSAALIIRPVLSLWQPARELIDQPLTWSGAALRWTQILWALCVWSFFGTAISRITAVQFAADERIGLKETLRFAGSKFVWAVSAPLMPLAGVLGLWLASVTFGAIGRIPAAGGIFLGVLWIVPLLLAFAMLLLLIGILLGWPLMVATISTQGSDAFDGFSRSFDYVYSRFWHLLWFSIVAMIFGLVTLAIVGGAANLILHWAITFASVGRGEMLPAALSPFAANCIAGWEHAVAMLVAGYAISYFWSASTIIYFLLRQSEDANHLSEVYREKMKSDETPVPLAGVAASDQPAIERPPKHEPETRQDPPTDAETE